MSLSFKLPVTFAQVPLENRETHRPINSSCKHITHQHLQDNGSHTKAQTKLNYSDQVRVIHSLTSNTDLQSICARSSLLLSCS